MNVSRLPAASVLAVTGLEAPRSSSESRVEVASARTRKWWSVSECPRNGAQKRKSRFLDVAAVGREGHRSAKRLLELAMKEVSMSLVRDNPPWFKETVAVAPEWRVLLR